MSGFFMVTADVIGVYSAVFDRLVCKMLTSEQYDAMMVMQEAVTCRVLSICREETAKSSLRSFLRSFLRQRSIV